MEEKVLYVKLPEDDKYRKVAITEDGIPKPERLLGGTEVYQKEGVPYWYCKIKNGRDEFMHLYTEDLVEEDLYFDSKTGKKTLCY
ncbi:MAG: hypothetical protein IJE05_04965 [Clostridia bacterium]|nr:hypothetical protein [Clostridia bacterium]